jgi:hypothetical protein
MEIPVNLDDLQPWLVRFVFLFHLVCLSQLQNASTFFGSRESWPVSVLCQNRPELKAGFPVTVGPW